MPWRQPIPPMAAKIGILSSTPGEVIRPAQRRSSKGAESCRHGVAAVWRLAENVRAGGTAWRACVRRSFEGFRMPLGDFDAY